MAARPLFPGETVSARLLPDSSVCSYSCGLASGQGTWAEVCFHPTQCSPGSDIWPLLAGCRVPCPRGCGAVEGECLSS